MALGLRDRTTFAGYWAVLSVWLPFSSPSSEARSLVLFSLVTGTANLLAGIAWGLVPIVLISLAHIGLGLRYSYLTYRYGYAKTKFPPWVPNWVTPTFDRSCECLRCSDGHFKVSESSATVPFMIGLENVFERPDHVCATPTRPRMQPTRAFEVVRFDGEYTLVEGRLPGTKASFTTFSRTLDGCRMALPPGCIRQPWRAFRIHHPHEHVETWLFGLPYDRV